MGLSAVVRGRRFRSRCTGQLSPSARSGATVCRVRAEALARNSGAYYLLTVLDARRGKVAKIESEVRAPRPAPALARAQRPRLHDGPVSHARAALRPPRALASSSPHLPRPRHAAPHMPSTPPALHARALGPRAR